MYMYLYLDFNVYVSIQETGGASITM